MSKLTNDVLSKALYFLPDKPYCKLTFSLRHKRKPNLSNPSYLSDKLLYLKLFEKNPTYKQLVDKFDVRDHIKNTIGEEFLIPLIGVYEHPSEVDFESLPNKFVLKLSHASQLNVICQDKSLLDWDKTSKQIEKWLEIDFYKRTREWQYKDLKHRFVIEEFISDSNGELNDFKFWCFNGQPTILQVDLDRFGNHERDYYSVNDYKKLDLSITYKNSNRVLPKPENYEKMVEIAKTLSKDLPFVRVDLYNVDGKIYFGELTFCPDNCNGKIYPFKYEKTLGEKLVINN